MKSRGIFITFEGMDGSGKTTQMHRLAERLRSLGRTVTETVEPGGPPIAQKIRRILLDSANQELSPTTEVLLYFASRAQNVDERILPTSMGFWITVNRRIDEAHGAPAPPPPDPLESFSFDAEQQLEMMEKDALRVIAPYRSVEEDRGGALQPSPQIVGNAGAGCQKKHMLAARFVADTKSKRVTGAVVASRMSLAFQVPRAFAGNGERQDLDAGG